MNSTRCKRRLSTNLATRDHHTMGQPTKIHQLSYLDVLITIKKQPSIFKIINRGHNLTIIAIVCIHNPLRLRSSHLKGSLEDMPRVYYEPSAPRIHPLIVTCDRIHLYHRLKCAYDCSKLHLFSCVAMTKLYVSDFPV